MLTLGLGRAVQMVIMFATYRLLSTFFSTEEMSSYYFLLSISGIFGLIIANPIGMYLFRIAHRAKNENELNSLVSVFSKIMLCMATIIIPIVFIVQGKLEKTDISIFVVSLMLFSYVVGTTLNGTFVSMLNILSINNVFVVLTILTSLIGLLLSFVSIKFVSNDPIFWLLGQSVSLIFFGFIALFYIKKKINEDKKIYKINKKEIYAFCFPILLTNIFAWIMSQSFRFFLKGSVNDSLLGEMAFGLGLASALAVAVEYLFQQLLFPGFYAALNDTKEDREKSWNKLFSKSAPAYICLIMYMSILSPFILNILADDKFSGAVAFFSLGAVCELFRMLGNMVNMAFQSEMKTKKAISSYAAGGVLTLMGVMFICFNRELLYVTPYVLIIGQFAIFLTLFLNLKKIMKIDSVVTKLTQYLLMSLPFLLSTFLYNQKTILISILTCAVFGLYLLFLFYKIQKDKA